MINKEKSTIFFVYAKDPFKQTINDTLGFKEEALPNSNIDLPL